MARITVEDCLKNIDNQFDLVMTAAKRARMIANGADALVELENDKPTVVALREIAAGLINDEILADMKQPIEDILSSEEAEELLASTPIPGQETEALAATAPPLPPVEPAAPAVPPVAEIAPAAEAAPAADGNADDLLADAIAAELAAAAEAPAEPAAEEAPAADDADSEDKPAE